MIEFIVTCDGGSLSNGSVNSHGYGSYMINAPGNVGEIKRLQFGEGNVGEIKRLQFGEGVTSNEAEYMALIGALENISSAFLAVAADLKTIQLTIRTDSQLVIGQLSRGHKINAPNLRPLVIQASSLCQQFFLVQFEQITGVEMKKILGH